MSCLPTASRPSVDAKCLRAGGLRCFRLVSLVLMMLGACGSACTKSGVIADYEKRVIDLQDQLRECETRRLSDKERFNQLVRRVQGGTSEPQFDPDRLFTPVEIQIDPLTGGSNWDGKPGDDGVTVYVKPIDRDGDAVKAAGDVRIEILDLDNPADQQLVGRYGVEADQLGKLWYGKLMTQHYTFECPWTKSRPRHEQLTVRVTFIDYATKKTLTAQGLCAVKLAG